MIVHCEQCGTTYNLDDAKVKPGETKVRCSQCQYVFTVPHPLTLNEEEIFSETEEKVEDGFLKEWAQEFPAQPPQKPNQTAPPAPDQAPPPRAFVPPTAEESLFAQELPSEEAPSPKEEELPFKVTPVEEAPAKKERKASITFLLAILLVAIIFVSFYYWTKKGVSIPAFEYIYEKLYNVMEGEKAQKVFLLSPRGSEYTVDGGTVYVIQGKVANRSQETKNFVKVKGSLFDKTGKVVATSIGFGGITMANEEIKNSSYESLKSSFGFIGVRQAPPVPSQQTLPFTIIFFSPPKQATQYQVEIVETAQAR